jgi:hypothetical protein
MTGLKNRGRPFEGLPRPENLFLRALFSDADDMTGKLHVGMLLIFTRLRFIPAEMPQRFLAQCELSGFIFFHEFGLL